MHLVLEMTQRGYLTGSKRGKRDVPGPSVIDLEDYVPQHSASGIADPMIVVLNTEGKVTSMNSRARDALSLHDEEPVGKDWFDTFVPPTERERRRAAFSEFIRRVPQELTISEVRVLGAGGKELTVNWSSIALKDARNRVIAVLGMGQDATESRRAENLIEYQASLIDNVTDAIIARDTDMVIKIWNKAAEKMYGWTAEEVIGRGPKDSSVGYHGVDRPDLLDRLIKEGRVRWEAVQERKDGGKIFVEGITVTLRDARGEATGFLSVNRDITERKIAEEDLRNTRNYLESLVNYANAPIIVWDPTFKITRFNHAFERMTGYSADEVLGKELQILFPSETREETLVKIEKTLAGEQWESVEIPILRKDGGLRWALWNSANIHDEDGKTLVATIAQGQDITERMRNEEDLRETRDYLESLFNYANAPIIVWDSSSRITRFNRAFERFSGYRAEEILGKPLDVLFPLQSREESLARINETLVGEHWESVEIPILRKDGKVRMALWNSANIYSKDGRTLVATIAQGQDITERKRAEEDLIDLNESLARQKIELEALNRELEAFNYSVSHDLRAPLRAMDGFSAALMEDYYDKLDETGRDYVVRVREASQKMARLIDDLLKLSRVTREKMNWETVDLSAIAREISAEMRASQPERSADFIIQDGARMIGDPRLLRILMENLIGNAWKFTARRSKAIIEFGIAKAEGETVFYVRDNGAGFDYKYVDKLFTPFQRLHSSKEFPGTGIGLATSMRIMRRHGGRMWAESDIDKGAVFYFTRGTAGRFGEATGGSDGG